LIVYQALGGQLPSATPRAVILGLIYRPIWKQACDNLQESTSSGQEWPMRTIHS